ncbi:MAG TPA: YggT family protein, partial [Gaiellaceae bacterium]|nr:YggT family protein [Gaiellaceae bacterium]
RELTSMGGIGPCFTLLLDAVTSAQQFVNIFVGVYVLLILVYIVMTWVRLPYSLWLNRIQRFLYDVCDPYLRLFRKILPPLGPLDLSPIVGVLVLVLLERIVIALLGRLH